MTTSHQQNEYNQLQGARPCYGRGELELKTQHNPESACCKEKGIVIGVGFTCSILNKTITDLNLCWACTKRKEQP